MVQEQRSPVGLRVDESPTLAPLSPATSASPGSAHGRFLPGTIFAGRYGMIELLGRGGMGEVCRAEDLEVGQTVALKFLPSSVAGDEIALARRLKQRKGRWRRFHWPQWPFCRTIKAIRSAVSWSVMEWMNSA